MRSILEQAIVHQLNGEADKAQELFHQFVVARARQIHESMRNGEDPLAEGWEENVNADAYFTEEDLASLEDGDDVDASDTAFADDEADMDAPDALDGADAGVDELEDDLGDHVEEDEELRDEVDELSAKLAELEAKFAELSGDDDDFGDEEDFGDDDGFGAEQEGPVEDDMEMSDEDETFESLGESIADELDTVEHNATEDGKEIGAAGAFAQNRKTPLPQKKVGERQGGKPLELKSSSHTHFNREEAPSVADMKKRRNTMKKSTEQQDGVKGGAEKGDGKELGGKSLKKNTKSPLSGLSKN